MSKVDQLRPLDIRQALGFLSAGAVGFLVDMTVLGLLLHIGLNPIVGRAASILLAMLATYILNRTLTFAGRRGASSLWREFPAYFLASSLGLAVNFGLYSAVVAATDAHPLVAASAATAAAMFLNFFTYRVVVFGDRVPDEPTG